MCIRTSVSEYSSYTRTSCMHNIIVVQLHARVHRGNIIIMAVNYTNYQLANSLIALVTNSHSKPEQQGGQKH